MWVWLKGKIQSESLSCFWLVANSASLLSLSLSFLSLACSLCPHPSLSPSPPHHPPSAVPSPLCLPLIYSLFLPSPFPLWSRPASESELTESRSGVPLNTAGLVQNYVISLRRMWCANLCGRTINQFLATSQYLQDLKEVYTNSIAALSGFPTKLLCKTWKW